ncbi:HlyIII-domain-containing protein [Bimuria novae-zelandiae CBS 107.79]|uniref:HlyIII-domain-containing protein n=1 Tax=Bimuria novae-zelandiae CBS 107.79 TaxID=1447943 RepID=A0A6A5V1C3_9PLEO|nr:HlyIII-domain-containing protein [Bimuria novae-zelandiae CBS 107.79]
MASLAIALRLPLLLFRRPSKNGRKTSNNGKDTDDSEAPQKLLTYNQLPDWYRAEASPFITSHYRPVSNSVQRSVHSLAHLHNETANIYTHLVPAVVLALGLPILQVNISATLASAPYLDRFMLTLTPLAALLTFSLSANFHTLANHSDVVSLSCLLLDFTGILVLILASFISGIYVGFYNHPFERRLYWSMITILIATSAVLVLHPKLQGMNYRPHRTTAFVLTTLSGLGPTLHGMYVHGVSRGWHECGVKWWAAEGVWYALGVVFFVSRWPERWAWRDERKRGIFDVWGGSHSLFHCCVVVGAACHCWGVWEAWSYAV